MVRVLVAYASERGGTAEIAEWAAGIARGLRRVAVVRPAVRPGPGG